MRLHLLGLCIALAAPHGSSGTPIDGSLYYHVVNEDGDSGPCRGTGASDKVESKAKGGMTQAMCEDECTVHPDCVGYSYSAEASDGLCIIYGPGMDGVCTSDPTKAVLAHCGSCSIDGKEEEGVCGSCQISVGSPEYADAASYADNEGLCGLRVGLWTPGVWTAGEWDHPEDDWEGDSHFTTHINYITPVGGYDCYDKDTGDHEPKCVGTTDAGLDCAVRFADETIGKDLEDLTEADCTSGGTGCTFSPAPVPHVSVSYVHSPIFTGPGWNPHNVPFGDALNPDVPIAIGACRSEGTQIAPPNQKYCLDCLASDGSSVGTQDGCALACLDDPSGQCMGYSHADFSWCVIHGPVAHLFPNHTAADGRIDEWTVASQPTKFCLGNVPNNPPGCVEGDTAKPNPKYMCQTLMTTPERWDAYGARADKMETVSVGVWTTGEVDAFEDNYRTALVERMAALAFWHADETELVVSPDDGGGVLLSFFLMADMVIAEPMENLMASQFDTAEGATLLLDGVLPDGAVVVKAEVPGPMIEVPSDSVDMAESSVDSVDVAESSVDSVDVAESSIDSVDMADSSIDSANMSAAAGGESPLVLLVVAMTSILYAL